MRKYGTCFFERYAQISLESLLGEKFAGLLNKDRPDLQSPDGLTLGIEVTRAMEESRDAARSLLKEIAGIVPTAEDIVPAPGNSFTTTTVATDVPAPGNSFAATTVATDAPAPGNSPAATTIATDVPVTTVAADTPGNPVPTAQGPFDSDGTLASNDKAQRTEADSDDMRRIVESGYGYGLQDGRFIGSRELEYWSLALPMMRILESKISKAASGLYGEWRSLGLYIFCKDNLTAAGVNDVCRRAMELQAFYGGGYDRLYLSEVSCLHVCDLSTGNSRISSSLTGNSANINSGNTGTSSSPTGNSANTNSGNSRIDSSPICNTANTNPSNSANAATGSRVLSVPIPQELRKEFYLKALWEDMSIR